MTSARREIFAVLLDDYVDYQRAIVDSIKSVVQASGYGMLCIAARMSSCTTRAGNALRNQYLMTSLEEKSRNLKHANEELSRLANYDSLTRLPNRLMFMQHLGDLCRPTPGEPRQAAFKNILCYYRNELNAVPDRQQAHGQIGR